MVIQKMTDSTLEKIEKLSPVKQALFALEKKQAELDAIKSEPIAIIGLGCRFPGANNPDAYWQLLRNGIDAITEVSSDRWNVDNFFDPDPDVPGKTYTRHGGFLSEIDRFEPMFFGISPREATYMDPQQRLLLEIAWEALEDAGLVPGELINRPVGVFIGDMIMDYGAMTFSGHPEGVTSHTGTGSGASFLAGRLAYVLGLQGPAVAMDTACSSSLVAIHLACQSLRSGESELVLAGGVQLNLLPNTEIFMSRIQALSPDGRCKTFDASANGIVRGEGCGVIVLKRLSDALADKDNILALIRGSAVGHDGPSNGLTVPNRLSQEKVISRALKNAKATPADISYVEAHGTGTSLGDPIEVGALGTVFADNHSQDSPLTIGSVKTNFGHLEAAAGIAGLIKTVLALQHQEIPPHLHFNTPNPHIDWENLPFQVPVEGQSWPRSEKTRIAGVSSFGMSGTNAHVVLEEAPSVGWGELANPNKDVSGKDGSRDEFVGVRSSPQPTDPAERPFHLLTLSAKSEAALAELAGSYAAWLETRPEVPFADVCFTASTGRSHFEHRLALVAGSSLDAEEKLRAADHILGKAGHEKPKIAFLFTGQGSEYPGMGRQLYETQPLFRETLGECDAILRPLNVPLLDLLYPDSSEPNVDISTDMRYLQPVLFALEYALARVWRSWGIEPDVVMGHSIGEYVAACVAGVFSLEDGLKLIANRGRLMQTCPEGRMLAVSVSEEKAREIIAPFGDAVSVATINAPESVVLSGKPAAIESILAGLADKEDIETKLLPIPRASHSPLMEQILAEFEQIVRSVTYSRPGIPLCSNMTGELVTEEVTDPTYWVRHVRQPVRFARSIETLHGQGFNAFLEVGPKPALLGMTGQCLPGDAEAVFIPTLREGQDDWRQILGGLGQWYVHGGTVDWVAFDKAPDNKPPRRKVQLPTYPFQRERYWIDGAIGEGRRVRLSPERTLLDLPQQEEGGQPSRGLWDMERLSEEEREQLSSILDKLAKPYREGAIANGEPELSGFILELEAIPAEKQRDHLAAYIQSQLNRVLGFPASRAMDPRKGFFDLGMDSLMAIELRNRLQTSLDCPLPSTLAFKCPTLDTLVDYIAGEVLGQGSPEEVPNQQKGLSVLDATEAARTEPIAVIGMGCRFPGADNPDAYWRLLRNGVDAIGKVPLERWDMDDWFHPDPAVPGKAYAREAGFLSEVDRFDPRFFGISPREAMDLDPQQRLLLEVVWESLENACQAPEELVGAPVGIFIGSAGSEYLPAMIYGHPESITSYAFTGGSMSLMAGRLSYVLGTQGPVLTMDTACSSSLVAVHQACLSLRTSECDLALAGGVNLILSPESMVILSKMRALSPDGRCKAFDASADGYGRGEGCGVVVLKRLSNAMADRDNILAVIRGSAIGHDGVSSGLTVPSETAQEKVIRRALEDAGAAPTDVSYIEAHGTGTSLGDPIEISALDTVFSRNHSGDFPLTIGSVKTNFGHLEGAAGIAGLMKVVLALQHEEIPPHLHFETPNPHIDWERLPFTIPTEGIPWSRGEKTRIAGVSSFGASGTNAHVVLEEAPSVGWGEPEGRTPTQEVVSNAGVGVRAGRSPQPTAPTERPLHMLTLSAKTDEALRELAENHATYLKSNQKTSLADICFTANTGRSHFEHRIALVAQSVEEAHEWLRTKNYIIGKSAHARPKIAFLFTGQGSQYVGMGQQLYETQALFRQIIDQCDAILRTSLETPLPGLLYPSSKGSDIDSLDRTSNTQPALFALEYALAKLWQSWGITPDTVMGHSVGEYVAACIAGVFSLEDGLKLIAARGHLMQTLCEKGDMLALPVSEAEVLGIIAPFGDAVSIAAINGPESVVISGTRQAINTLSITLADKGIEFKPLVTSHAFHSGMMEPMLGEFERVVASVTYAKPEIPLCANVTGEMVTDEITTPAYWVRHVRQPVRFSKAVETLYKDGVDTFLEIGPKPALLGMARQCLPNGTTGTWLPSLREGQDDWRQMLQSLGELYVQGGTVNWAAFDKNYPRRKVSVPTYPFQRQRYWMERTPGEGRKIPLLSKDSLSDLLQQGNTEQLTSQLKQTARFLELLAEQLPIPPPLLSELTRNTPSAAESMRIKDQLAQTSEEEHEKILIDFIRNVFAGVLKMNPSQLDIQQPLSTMGLDSLIAMEMRNRIRSELDVDVPMAKFVGEISVLDLARQIQARLADIHAMTDAAGCEKNTWFSGILFPFRTGTGNHKPPLFCIHPVGGGALGYQDLANCLDEKQPIYGIQAVGFEGESDLLTDIPTMATRYMEEITRVWPEGPYNLYGWSFGGMVAFEMARLLRLDNREVALLALGDTPAPSPLEKWPEEPREDEIILHILMESGNEENLLPDELQNLMPADRLAYLKQRVKDKSGLAASRDLDRIIRIYQANSQAFISYQPSSREGSLVFIAAAENNPKATFGVGVNPVLWEGFANRVDHHVVPGDHFTMHRPPNVRRIGEILSGLLT